MENIIFVDRFDDSSYTLSKKTKDEYAKDIAVVHNYHRDNPSISITGNHTLLDIKKIIYTIEEQQKDINMFGKMLIELSAE
jgi:hypothetical protein|tara:strand:- start:6576 stop:6818 length:243 start_codon:yes stop_codon:yes gene_type:complete